MSLETRLIPQLSARRRARIEAESANVGRATEARFYDRFGVRIWERIIEGTPRAFHFVACESWSDSPGDRQEERTPLIDRVFVHQRDGLYVDSELDKTTWGNA